MDKETQQEKIDKWDSRFMQIAKEVGLWCTCHRRNVGAVIVRDKRIIATGYNGAPAGIQNCLERGYCLRNKMNIPSGTKAEICYAVHAEQNAIIQASRLGISIDGATLYVTHQPCTICTKLIINSGIKKIVYGYEYPDEFSMDLLKESGIELKYMPFKEEK